MALVTDLAMALRCASRSAWILTHPGGHREEAPARRHSGELVRDARGSPGTGNRAGKNGHGAVRDQPDSVPRPNLQRELRQLSLLLLTQTRTGGERSPPVRVRARRRGVDAQRMERSVAICSVTASGAVPPMPARAASACSAEKSAPKSAPSKAGETWVKKRSSSSSRPHPSSSDARTSRPT